MPKSGKYQQTNEKKSIHDLLAFLPNLWRLFCTLWSAVKFILRKDPRLVVHLFLLPESWACPEAVGFPLQHPPLQLAYSSQHLLAIFSWQAFWKEADCKKQTCSPKTHLYKKWLGSCEFKQILLDCFSLRGKLNNWLLWKARVQMLRYCLKNSASAVSQRWVHTFPSTCGLTATRAPNWGFSSFTGQNKHNKLQKIQYLLHEMLAFSSREALFNRLSALFFMTASVSFYQAFFSSNTQSLLRLAFESDLVLTCTVKTTNHENKMLASKQGIETVLVCRADWVWFHHLYPPRAYWWHGNTPGSLGWEAAPQINGIPKTWKGCRDALQSAASSTWLQDFHL